METKGNGTAIGVALFLSFILFLGFEPVEEPELVETYYKFGAIGALCLIAFIVGLWKLKSTLFLVLGGFGLLVAMFFLTIGKSVCWTGFLASIGISLSFFLIAIILEIRNKKKDIIF